jgi:hypothetical protein
VYVDDSVVRATGPTRHLPHKLTHADLHAVGGGVVGHVVIIEGQHWSVKILLDIVVPSHMRCALLSGRQIQNRASM